MALRPACTHHTTPGRPSAVTQHTEPVAREDERLLSPRSRLLHTAPLPGAGDARVATRRGALSRRTDPRAPRRARLGDNKKRHCSYAPSSCRSVRDADAATWSALTRLRPRLSPLARRTPDTRHPVSTEYATESFSRLSRCALAWITGTALDASGSLRRRPCAAHARCAPHICRAELV